MTNAGHVAEVVEMSVLIEAKAGEQEGWAYLPYEVWNRRRLPVKVVDRYGEFKELLSNKENARLLALLNLQQALNGESATRKDINDAAKSAKDAVISWSRAMQKSIES
jgi:hypothetical protein